mgnify:CR=1 FL=1
MRSRIAVVALVLGALVVATHAATDAAEDPTAATVSPGTQPGSPWPTMRHDLRNTGASELVARDTGLTPWSVPTGRGIFSTPVVASDGTIYVGSADHTLYGLNREGDTVWTYRTRGIIDTAPALLAPEPGVGQSLVFGSGDQVLRRVRTDPDLPRGERTVWELDALPVADGSPQLVSWWEGSPNVGPDGTIFQGNTGSQAYAINPDGTIRWAVPAGDAVWTVPALDEQGNSYWGSVDTRVFALDPDGGQLWQRTTLGYVTSSPALSLAGTLYVGSFDGQLYALDSASGSVQWTLATGDHIYASPALIESPDGVVEQIIIGSTDGTLYSAAPDGTLLWEFDTGAPIRSSPVVGRSAEGDWVVYVGNAGGHVVAVDAAAGTRRWAFDTTSREPELATRNQLNSSPALTRDGVVLGSQDGTIWFVPYDYCLRAKVSDRRCVPQSSELPADGTYLYPVNVGGGLVTDGTPAVITPAGYFTGRLVVRDGGRTVPARMIPSPDAESLVTVEPEVAAEVSLSGDGRYVFVRPTDLLPSETEFTVTVGGLATVGGPRLGNLHLGPGEVQPFRGEFRVRTGPDGDPPRFAPGEGLSLSRLAVTLPPMLTSVNQIGFDFYDLIGTQVDTDAAEPVTWFVGARRTPAGRIVSDPAARFAFATTGEQRSGEFAWSAQQVNLWFTFGPVPLRRFDLRGTFGADGVVRADSQFFAEAVCAGIPGYGTRMPITGMCDTEGVITAAGTFLAEITRSPAARSPRGVTIGDVEVTDGRVTATVDVAPGVSYGATDHFVSILLIDELTGQPLPLDYFSGTTMSTDESGNITGTSVALGDTSLPERTTAIVMTDAYAATRTTLSGGASSSGGSSSSGGASS